MLEILIVKDNQQYALELSPDIAINITMENPVMAEDRIPVPYSLTFEIPSTPNNLLLFEHPNRIPAYKQDHPGFKKMLALIRFNGLNVLQGHIQLTKYSNALSLFFIGLDVTEYLKKQLYQLDFGRKYFEGSYADVNYDSSFNFMSDYLEWTDELFSASRGDILAAPIAIKETSQPLSDYVLTRPSAYYANINYDDTGKYIRKQPYISQDDEFINAFYPDFGGAILKRHPLDSNNFFYNKVVSSIFPCFRVGYIFDVIFGNLLENNPLSFGSLYDLVLPTHFFPQWQERYGRREYGSTVYGNHYPPLVSNPRPNPDSAYPSQPYVELADYLPDVSTSEFVKSVCNLFCLTIVPVRGKLNIYSNSSVLNSPIINNWKSKRIDIVNVQYFQKKKYVYGPQENESKPELILDEISVSDVYAMVDHSYTLDDDHVYEAKFILPNAQYIKSVFKERMTALYDNPYKDVEEDKFNYIYIGEKVEGQNVIESEIFDMSTSIKTMGVLPSEYYLYVTNRPADPDEWNVQKSWMTPSISLTNRSQRPTAYYLAFHLGMAQTNSTPSFPYPLLGSNNELGLDPTKNLNWNGEDGLFENYHKEFAAWIEKDKISLNATFLLSHLDLHNLDISEKVHVDGRNFFIEKLQFTIYLDHISPVLADLIEA